MSNVLQAILMIFAGIDITLGTDIALGWGNKRTDNRLFVVMAYAGAVWSIFFGQLLVQSDHERAYLCRCIGLIGTFAYLFGAVWLITIWSGISKIRAKIYRICTALCLIIYPFICRRTSMNFRQTAIGMSYTTRNDFWGILYNIYSLAVAAFMLDMIVRLLNTKNKRRIRSIGLCMLGTLACMGVGAVLDTLLPMLGYAAIPGSTFMQFFGIVITFYTLNYVNKNEQSIEGVAYQLFTTIKAAILVYNDSPRLVLMSDEAKRMMNLSEDMTAGTQLNEIFMLDENPLSDDRDFATYATKIRTNDTDCELEVSVLRDNYGDVNGYFAIAYDTSERARFIKQLEAERIRADEANIAKTAFLANMSHEIRTPINTVLGMNEMIRRESESPAITGYSANIKLAGETLLSVINDILDFSKVEAGMMEISSANYDLRNMLSGLIEMFRLKCNEKGLEFRTDIDAELPLVLYGDEIRIRQVMINLLGNAVKYTMSGSVTFIVKCIRKEDSTVRIRFAVKDTGIGISDKNFISLFDSFTRFDSRNTRNIEGTGLGLSIVKKLADLMDAKLDVDSVYGQGSTFSFELDQKAIDLTPIGDILKKSAKGVAVQDVYRPSFTAPEAAVLVVDDNRMNLEVIKGLLKKTGIAIDTAMSGRECLEKVCARKYDMILLDHMMPGMDGIETLKTFGEIPKENNPSSEAVVIALTANAIYGAREMYLENGFTDYLTKPVESERLEETLRKYLPTKLVFESCEAVKEAAAVKKTGAAEEAKSAEETEETEETEEELPAIPGISIENAMQYCGSLEVFRDTAKTFCDTARETVSALALYRETRDVENYRILIHSVKTNGRTLGCETLYEYALSQEQLCKESSFDAVVADSDRPETEILRLAGELGDFLEAEADSSHGEAPFEKTDMSKDSEVYTAAGEEEFKELMRKTLEALEDFDDISAVGFIEKMLKLCSIPGREEKLLEALAHCRVYDYTSASDCLKQINMIDPEDNL